MEMNIMNYVKPELIVVAVALYFLGMALKQAQAVKDKYIPLILGGVAVATAIINVSKIPINLFISIFPFA